MQISSFLDQKKNWAILLHWKNAGCLVCPKASGWLEVTKKGPSLLECYIWGCCGYVIMHCLPLHCLDLIHGSCTVLNLPHPSTNPQSFLFCFKIMFSIQTTSFLFYQISFLFYILKIQAWWLPLKDRVLETMEVKVKQTGCKRISAGGTQQFFSSHWTLHTKHLFLSVAPSLTLPLKPSVTLQKMVW